MVFRLRMIAISLLWAFGLCWWLLAVGRANAQAATITQLTISDVDASHFPVVTVTFTALNANNRPVRGLAADDFQFAEDEHAVTTSALTPTEGGPPVSLMLLIDQGPLSITRYRQNYNELELKSLFERLGSHYLREGDFACVAVGSLNGNVTRFDPRLPCNSFSAEYQRVIDELDLYPDEGPDSINSTQHGVLLEAAITQLSGQPDPVLVFFSSYIHASSETPMEGKSRSQTAAERLAAQANAAGIRIFVLQAGGGTVNPNTRFPMRTLAERTNGRYVELIKDADLLEAVQPAFEAIRETTVTYTFVYRSTSGASGERILSLASRERPNLAATYPLTVTLAEPVLDGEEFVITPMSGGRQQLSIPLTWPPDGFPRELATVTVNGTQVEAEDFDLLDGILQITFNAQETETIEVTVEDELGMVAQTTVQIVTPVPPTATPTPTPIPPVMVVTPSPPAVTLLSPSDYLPWVVLGIVLLGAAAYLIGSRRGAFAPIGKGVGAMGQRFSTIATGRKQKQALAHLHVLTGREDLLGGDIALYNEITTIGRDPQLTDIQLYAPHERSSISGQHCTIQFDHGNFLIIDNNSANGTTVNGTALEPDLPHVLQDGDEIVFGDKARHGAQVRFTISDSARQRYSVTIAEGAWPGGTGSGKKTMSGPGQNDAAPELPSDPNPSPDLLPELSPEEEDDRWMDHLE